MTGIESGQTSSISVGRCRTLEQRPDAIDLHRQNQNPGMPLLVKQRDDKGRDVQHVGSTRHGSLRSDWGRE